MSRASYPKVKRGHVVPAVYQRNFAVDEQVLVHFVSDGHAEIRNVRTAGTKKAFYRRIRPDDGTEIDDIEASLSALENAIQPVFTEIRNGSKLSIERKGALAQFFGIQLLRGPAFFAERQGLIDEIVSQLDETMVKPAAFKAAGGNLRVVQQQVRDAYSSSTAQFTTMLTTGMKIAMVLGCMRWQLLDFGAPLLAYSDQPVVVWPADLTQTRPFWKPFFGPLDAIEVRVPLSPELAILMSWSDMPDTDERVPASPTSADELNAFVVAQADEQWMHRPGKIPPIGVGSFTPLAPRLETSYGASCLARSRRRATAAHLLSRVRNKQLLGDIKIADIR